MVLRRLDSYTGLKGAARRTNCGRKSRMGYMQWSLLQHDVEVRSKVEWPAWRGVVVPDPRNASSLGRHLGALGAWHLCLRRCELSQHLPLPVMSMDKSNGLPDALFVRERLGPAHRAARGLFEPRGVTALAETVSAAGGPRLL